ERHFAEWLLEPVSLFRTLFIDLVLRVEGVGRQRQRVHRAELQGRLSIDALAREFRIVVPAVVGDRDQLILGGRVCNDGARNTPRHRRERLDRPTVHRRAGGSAFTLLVRAEQGDAEHLVRVRPRGDPRNLGIDPEVLVAEVVKRLRADTSAQALASSIERPLRDNVDGRTDTARRNRGPAGLVDFKAADTFSREIREVERTAGGAAEVHREVAADGVDVGSRNLTPVDGNEIKGRTEAADRDLRAFAVAAFDAHPRNTLKRFGEVGIWELADVFGRDGVDDARRVAFDVHRALESAANACDDNFIIRGSNFLRSSGGSATTAGCKSKHRSRTRK